MKSKYLIANNDASITTFSGAYILNLQMNPIFIPNFTESIGFTKSTVFNLFHQRNGENDNEK